MFFNLPQSTIVNRFIPKNSFEDYTTSKQKKSFTELVEKIKWLNKLSRETINLSGKEIAEIQIFEITLKKKDDIASVLNLIDRSIPYPIIFVVIFENDIQISASQKHINPNNENLSVIDWTFATGWRTEHSCVLNLQQSLDYIWSDFCKQISGRYSDKLSLKELIKFEQMRQDLNLEIKRLKNAVKTAKQYNNKVTLNIELQRREKELSLLELQKYQ